jgi:hypothetical protein
MSIIHVLGLKKENATFFHERTGQLRKGEAISRKTKRGGGGGRGEREKKSKVLEGGGRRKGRNTPEMLEMLSFQDGFLQARLLPQSGGKKRVIGLKAIVDADGLAALWTRGRGLERQGSQEGNVVTTE